MPRKLIVEVIGDPSQLERALGRAGASGTHFGGVMRHVGMAVAAGLAGAAIAAVEIGKKSVEAAISAQEANDRLTQAFKNQKIQMDANAPAVLKLEEAGRKLGFSNEDTRVGLTKLIQSGKSYAASATEMAMAQDLARAKGISLGDATTSLIRLQAGNTRAAKEFGVVLPPVTAAVDKLKASKIDLTTAEGKHALAMAKVQDKLATGQAYYDAVTAKVKGQGEAFAHSAAGGIARFQVELKNVEERLGQQLLPVLVKVLDWVSGHMPQIQAVASAAMKAVGQAVAWLSGQVSSHWTTITGVFRTAVGVIVAVGGRIVSFFQTDLGKAVLISATAMGGFAKAASLASVAIKGIGTAAALVGGGGPLLAIGALLTGITYLGLKLGVIHNPFAAASADARALSAALDSSTRSARSAADAFGALEQTNLDLASAHVRVAATLHDAQAAQQAYNVYANRGTQETLAGKQAHDAALAAWQAHKQAVLDLTSAVQAHDQAETKANQSILQAVPGMNAWTTQLAKMASLDGPAATKAARELGVQMVSAGQDAIVAAGKLRATDPAAAAASRSFGILQEAAGTLALRLGRIPTKKEIIAEAKLIGGRDFQQGLDTFVKAAQAAGLKIPEWLRRAAGPSRSAAGEIATGVKQPIGELPGAGTAAGRGAAAGVASGINSQAGAAVGAARHMVAQVKSALATWGSGPDEWANYAIGTKLIDGLAQGILQSQGKASDAAGKAVESVKARMQASQIAALIHQYGQTIGYEHARGVVMGILQGTPGIVQQARTALQQAMAAAHQAIVDSRASVVSAFNDLATQALAAFDAKAAAWRPPALILLDKMQLQDQIDAAKQAVTDAQTQLGNALVAANTAYQAYIGATQQSGESDADFETRKAQLKAQWDQAVADAAAAQKALGAAERAQRELNLQLEGAQQQKAHDARMARDRENLARQLAQLEKQLLAHPEAWRKSSEAVKTLLAKYDIPLREQGKKWASMFTGGLAQGLAALQKALSDFLNASNVGDTTPVPGGSAVGGKAAASFVGSARSSAAGGGGGGVHIETINIDVRAETDDPDRLAQQIAKPILREIAKHDRRNGGLALTYG